MVDSKLIIYKNSDGNIIVDAIYKDETLWLSQKGMSKVFNVGVPAISKHLKNIFAENELDKNSVVSKMEITAEDGKRYNTDVYSLDAIIAVGYRINSKKATNFRIWATKVLKEYMTKGFALNDERFIKGNKYDYKYSEYDEKYYGTDQENEEYDFTAPENEHAFCQRNVYHYAEDYNGNNIGRFKVARGRYMWMPDEDFRLFLRSIYECSEELLNRIDEETGRVHDSEYKIIYQAELAYLLAQQFTATSDTLGNILTSIDDAANVFYVGAMLEMLPESGFIKAGMKLFPAGIKKHRLYLMTRSGKEAGYISFKDDRLYYVLIPILEQKRAMVKIEVSSKQDRHNTMGEKKYKNIDLWVKIGNDATFPENINMRIEDLLNRYRESV